MIKIHEGEFIYGTDRKEYGNTTQKILIKSFWIDKYPVTNLEYKLFIDLHPNIDVPFLDHVWAKEYSWDPKKRMYPKGSEHHPAVLVKYSYIKKYCSWINKRLPTETEWEKAARGANGKLYPWGNEWKDNAFNSREMGINMTTNVKKFEKYSSEFGITDLIGNVWEWTSDEYEYGGYVIRGGSWQMSSTLINCLSRSGLAPYYISSALGWRCACDDI